MEGLTVVHHMKYVQLPLSSPCRVLSWVKTGRQSMQIKSLSCPTSSTHHA